MRKRNICVLFGGMSQEHGKSLCSAEAVLSNLDTEKYHIYPVGITRDGRWYLYDSTDHTKIATGEWEVIAENRPVAISPVRGQGLLCFDREGMTQIQLDAVLPLLHGKNGEDGAIQGLMQLAGIPCVGAGLRPSALAMDRTAAKLVAQRIGLPCAPWMAVHTAELHRRMEAVLAQVQEQFTFPVVVKPACNGADEGISKAIDGISLQAALLKASEYDDKIMIEGFVRGKKVSVAVMGNDSPMASLCGRTDYETAISEDGESVVKIPVQVIPADIDEQIAEQVRDVAVKMYAALDCRGLSLVDFFLGEDGQPVFDKISTMPDLTFDGMFTKLFEASGVAFGTLLDELVELAMEAAQ